MVAYTVVMTPGCVFCEGGKCGFRRANPTSAVVPSRAELPEDVNWATMTNPGVGLRTIVLCEAASDAEREACVEEMSLAVA